MTSFLITENHKSRSETPFVYHYGTIQAKNILYCSVLATFLFTLFNLFVVITKMLHLQYHIIVGIYSMYEYNIVYVKNSIYEMLEILRYTIFSNVFVDSMVVMLCSCRSKYIEMI